MPPSEPPPVHIDFLCRGPFFVADSDDARANKAIFERHLTVEWESDIDATMATMHPDNPWQRIPALGVNVNGFEAVRQYYLDRFQNWPGPAMKYFDRVSVTDTCIYTEGTLEIQPTGEFGGIDMAGAKISVPVVIVVDCRDGLIIGETVYLDGAAIRGQSAQPKASNDRD
jgi:predicted ester cyclase